MKSRAKTRRAPLEPPNPAIRRKGSLSGFSSSRAKILAAMRELACESGYNGPSASALIARARVSSRTFYENFTDTDECFIVAYEEATGEIEATMRSAYMRGGAWSQRVRAALEALLTLLESDRELAVLVFLEAPKARELLRGRRARLLEMLRLVLDSGRSGMHARETPALIDELLVEGSIAVIQARVAVREDGRLVGLLEELMDVITHSYIGIPALEGIDLPTGGGDPGRPSPGAVLATTPDRSAGRRPELRVTYRTLRVLTALAQKPGASTRALADAAGIGDQGQISRILRRLSDHEFVRNEGESRNGAPKCWYLTDSGAALRRRGARDLDRASASGGSAGA